MMKRSRVPVQLSALLCGFLLSVGVASASPLTLTGNVAFASLDGSAQDSDGVANGVFTVNSDLVIDGTIRCNDDAPLSPVASACPIRISVTGNLTMEPGSEIVAENRRALGNGGNVRLDVGGDLTLHGPDGSLPGALISTSQIFGTIGNAGNLTAVADGSIDFEAGSVLAASSQSGNAGAISVTGDTVRVAGLVASGPSRTVLPSRLTDVALAGGGIVQTGGTIDLHALGSSEPGLRIEPGAIVVSQGSGGGGRLILLEACGIEVRGLVASLSKSNGPSQVVLRSGKSILIDGRDLGSAAPAEGRFGRVRADGTQQGAAGYLVDLFAASDIQALGPDHGGLFAVSSTPGDLPLRTAGGAITAISLAGSVNATGNAFETGRDGLANKGGMIDLQAQGDVTLDDAVLRAVGGHTVLSTGIGGQISVRSFQGLVSWTFGRGDVRPTGSFVLPARRGTIKIMACSTVDTTGSQFPVNGGTVSPFPVETEGVCSPAAPSLPDGEPPLPVCVQANQPPAPAGGPFSVMEDSANGTVVGTVSANDPNPGQSHTFSIVSGNTGGAFAISGAGVITVANSAALDFTTNPVFHLTVEVTDNGTPPLSGTTTVTINVINNPEAPVANDEGTPANPYVETVGNTILEVAPSSVLTGAKVSFNGNILANDTDPDGPTAFTVTLESATAGAVVSLHPDGTFTYLPPPGFTGVDSFTYRITDPDGLSDTATVYVNVEHRVWYVKNDALAGGLGRSTEPFDTLVEAESASLPGDTIYLFEGGGTTAGQSDGITLKNGQRLIGEAVQLTIPQTVNINGVDGPALRSAIGNKPKIENDDTPDAPGEDNGVSVLATAGDATGVEIRGLEIAGFDNAIDVTATGANNAGVTIRDNAVSGATSEGIDVNAGSTGMVTLAIHDNTLAANGTAIDVQRTAGTVYVTDFANNTVSGNTAGTGINVFGAIFDAVPGGSFDPVSGGVTVIGSSGNGVGQSGLVLTSVQGGLSFSDLDVFADSGSGLRISGIGSGMSFGVSPSMGTIEATGGPAVEVTSVALALPLATIKSTNSPTTGLALNSVTGTFSAEAGSSISNLTSAAGTAFQIGGSNAAITYKGTITTTTGKGIDLTDNTGSTISFQGALNLSTEASTAFNATGGGTVASTDTSSTLTTTTGTALNVVSTAIGSDGLRFRSISANGASSGIVLNNTGASGGLTVTGSGTTAGSGGTIQNIANRGASFINASNISLKNVSFLNAATTNGSPCSSLLTGGNSGCNAPIHLDSVSTVALDGVLISGSAQQGINGLNVTGLMLSNSTVTGAGNEADENGVSFYNLLGSAAISNTSISGNFDDNLNIQNAANPASGSTMITITGGQFNAATQGSGIVLGARGASPAATISVDVSGCTIDNNFSGGLPVTAADNGTLHLKVSGCTITNNNDGIEISTSQGGNGTFDIFNNTSISGNDFLAVNVFQATTSTGTLQGKIRDNGNISVSNGRTTDALSINKTGSGAMIVAITNNVISYAGTQRAILIQAGDGNGTLDTTVTGNNVDVQLDGAGNSVAGLLAQASTTANTPTLCMDAGGSGVLRNTFTHSLGGSVAGGDIRVRQRNSGTVRLPGYAGAATDTAAAVAYLSGRNVVVSTPTATLDSIGFGGGGSCAQPTLP